LTASLPTDAINFSLVSAATGERAGEEGHLLHRQTNGRQPRAYFTNPITFSKQSILISALVRASSISNEMFSVQLRPDK
jgi:hypothetical protein